MTAEPNEVCFLIGPGGSVLWIDRSASAVAMEDSRRRWEAVWLHRGQLIEIAHSHPVGPLAFSSEDGTTMQAVDDALGAPLTYSVVARDGMLRISRDGEPVVVHNEPWWTEWLRVLSGMPSAAVSKVVAD